MDESNFKERRSEIEIRERLVKVEEAARTAADIMGKVSEKVDKLISAAQSQKSFLGGIVLVVSAIWAIIIFAKDWLVNHIK
jgi:hypothetical protein